MVKVKYESEKEIKLSKLTLEIERALPFQRYVIDGHWRMLLALSAGPPTILHSRLLHSLVSHV